MTQDGGLYLTLYPGWWCLFPPMAVVRGNLSPHTRRKEGDREGTDQGDMDILYMGPREEITGEALRWRRT